MTITTSPPTVSGWYWHRRLVFDFNMSRRMEIEIHQVEFNGDVALWFNGHEWSLASRDDEWCGPIPCPFEDGA